MATEQELAQALSPAFVNPNIQRQGLKTRALAAQRDVNTLPDPKTYAAISGLLGIAPDELGFSVVHPQYGDIQKVAQPAFAVGTALQVAPAVKLASKALGVGAKTLAPAAADMAEGFLQKQGLMPGVMPKQSSLLGNTSFAASQDEALRLAQQRAALPIKEGGLGLPADNTATQRAKAMGGKEQFHFSRTGGDFTTLDSGQYATAPFDAVGTHVGTKEAAYDRFRKTNKTIDERFNKGTSYPVTILGNKPLMNQNGMPWGEDDLNAFLRQTGGHNWSDVNKGNMTYQDLNAALRQKLFDEQGYTSIPYFNEVEAKGSISQIVPPENIRSRFAAFDPFRRNAAIAAAMGVAAPNLLASENNDKKESKVNSK